MTRTTDIMYVIVDRDSREISRHWTRADGLAFLRDLKTSCEMGSTYRLVSRKAPPAIIRGDLSVQP
jgi:hypothetical protein